jgi:cbb3-type cytochrome oxidase maturation protein
MSVLIFLIPITLALGLLGLGCFLWSLKSKQYEDLQGAASRILFDDLPEEVIQKPDKNIGKKSVIDHKN